MNKINKLAIKNKEIFWDIWDLSKLDELIIEERFLKYWNWKNIVELNKVIWKDKAKENYLNIRNKKRWDLWKKTINFFNLYYNV